MIFPARGKILKLKNFEILAYIKTNRLHEEHKLNRTSFTVNGWRNRFDKAKSLQKFMKVLEFCCSQFLCKVFLTSVDEWDGISDRIIGGLSLIRGLPGDDVIGGGGLITDGWADWSSSISLTGWRWGSPMKRVGFILREDALVASESPAIGWALREGPDDLGSVSPAPGGAKREGPKDLGSVLPAEVFTGWASDVAPRGVEDTIVLSWAWSPLLIWTSEELGFQVPLTVTGCIFV